MSTPTKVDDLEKLYNDGIEIDREVFAEMRSNILLVAGEHYSKNRNRLWDSLRDTRDVQSKQKLRLSRNHTHKISRIYEENILTHAPGVTILPKNESEMQDQKSAELHLAVWQDLKVRMQLEKRMRDLVSSYVRIGEVCLKAYWDPSKGKFLGYEQLLDPNGEPLFDEAGQPVADEAKAKFTGDLVVEEIYGFNIFRPAGCQTMDEAEWIGIRKMVSREDLYGLYGKDDPRIKKLDDSKTEEFVVFDMSRSEYGKTKDKILWKEIYHKPCVKYPMGYYQMFASGVLFEEGELPFGIFPIVYEAMETNQTNPRGRSAPIKIFRSFQAEINRASSSQAMAQITLGDDKVLYQAGTKLAPGAMLPGVRGITFQGLSPTILPGRAGEQYAQYILDQIQDGYRACMLEEENQEKDQVQDPMALLYRSMRQKKKFAKYASGFERFIVSLCELSLKLARQYLPEDEIIQAIGRSEAINISEFKNADPMRVQITVEPGDENLETKMGKHMVLREVLQYVGKQLKPEDIGRVLKAMPFVNKEKAFSDLTMDSESADNLLLALDRGQYLQANPYDNHLYMIKRLIKRMREASFQFLSPEIQTAYQQKLQEYEQMEADQQRKLIAAKSEYIPSDGPLVKADVYVGDPNNPDKQPKRAQIPQRAVEWLLQKLDDQGDSMDRLEMMSKQSLVDMADFLTAGGGNPRMLPAPQGNGTPAGVS